MNGLFDSWRNAKDGMEGCAEVGDKEGWERAKDECKVIENEIFALTGRRPPYASGWGVDLSRSED